MSSRAGKARFRTVRSAKLGTKRLRANAQENRWRVGRYDAGGLGGRPGRARPISACCSPSPTTATRSAGAGWRAERAATIYALALAVFCTSWTFFGSVGLASRSGLDFLAIYIGPDPGASASAIALLRPHRAARQVPEHHLDRRFRGLALRQERARGGASSRLIAVIGCVPYIALQLKAIAVLADHDAGALIEPGMASQRRRRRSATSPSSSRWCWPPSRPPSARAMSTPPSTRTA